jgi:hypothetical protein
VKLPTPQLRAGLSGPPALPIGSLLGSAPGRNLLPPTRTLPNLMTPAGLKLSPTVRNVSGLPTIPAGSLLAHVASPLAIIGGSPLGGSPGQQCRRAIAQVEKQAGIPDHLLAAIAHIESGRRDPQTGSVDPWPWSINVEGTDHIYDTEAEVIAAVKMYQSQGKRSIDVGCLQVNLMYHPDAFATLEQAFDPLTNAQYAAKFLTDLYRQSGTWPQATANYHSATPDLGGPYQQKVMAILSEEQHTPVPGGPPLTGQLAGLFAPKTPTLGGWTRMASLTMPVSPGAPLGSGGSLGGQFLPMPGLAARLLTGRNLDSYRATPVTLARR